MALPQLIVQVAFTTDPLDPAPSWSTVSTYADAIDIAIGKQAELDAYQPGTASMRLKNDDRRFDPGHAAGPYYPNVQPRKLIRIQAVWLGVTYDLYYGFVDGWSQKPNRIGAAEVPISCTDLFGILANIELPSSVYAVEVLADAPTAWWPMSEVAGDLMADASGNRFDGTYIGAPTLAVDLPDSEIVGVGFEADDDDARVVDQASVVSGTITLEAIVWLPEALDSSINYNVARCGNGLPPTTSGGKHAAIVIRNLGLGTSQSRPIAASNDPSGIITVDNIDLSYPRHIVYRSSPEAIFVDGVAVATTGPAFFLSQLVNGWSIGGAEGSSFAAMDGVISNVAGYSTSLSDARIAAHGEAFTAPWNGDTTGERIEHIAALVPLDPTQYNIDTGQTFLGDAELDGTALDYLRLIEATEQGHLYVDHADGGKLRFEDRHNRLLATRSTTVQATFTDEDTPGGVHVERDSIEILWDWQLIYNEVTVTFFGGGAVTVRDQSSIDAYGRRTHNIETILETAAEARNLAEWILSHYAEPIARIQSLELNPAGDDSSAVAALGLRLGDLVEVKLKPQNAGARDTYRLLVEGKQHHFDKAAGTWTTTLYLSPAETQVYAIWGTGTWGGSPWGY